MLYSGEIMERAKERKIVLHFNFIDFKATLTPSAFGIKLSGKC